MANLNAVAFDNPGVAGAANPSAFGYHYGPIPNNNEGWVPELPASRTVPAAVDVANPPNAAVALSTINGGICWIDVGSGICCGKNFTDQPALRRHLRCDHPGAVANPSRGTPNGAHHIAGTLALRHLVVSSKWRTMQFVHEPGRGPVNSVIGQCADACERIAASDPAFAATFGRQFHRQVEAPVAAVAGRQKRKRGPQPPPSRSGGAGSVGGGGDGSGDGSGHGSSDGASAESDGDGSGGARTPPQAAEQGRAEEAGEQGRAEQGGHAAVCAYHDFRHVAAQRQCILS